MIEINNIIESIRLKMIETQKEKERQANLLRKQQTAQYNANLMLQLQYELFQILKHQSSPLSNILKPLQFPADLLPKGIKTTPDGSMIFAFAWQKNKWDSIPNVILDKLNQNLNTQIAVYTARFKNSLYWDNLYPDNLLYLEQEHPMLIKGFRVAYSIDNGFEVVIYVQTVI